MAVIKEEFDSDQKKYLDDAQFTRRGTIDLDWGWPTGLQQFFMDFNFLLKMFNQMTLPSNMDQANELLCTISKYVVCYTFDKEHEYEFINEDKTKLDLSKFKERLDKKEVC
ncbi:MAG: hypothetical protein WC389_15175, partial [Lutibacter sp.]